MPSHWLAVSLTAFLGAAIVTRVSIWLAFRLGIVDKPNKIKIHSKPVARLGGMGVFGGCLAAATVLSRLEGIRDCTPPAVVVAASCIFATGLADDCWSLSPCGKVMGQLVGAVAYLALPRTIASAPRDVSLMHGLFVVVALIGFPNSFNLMDGMNGLLAGMCIITFAGGSIIAAANGMTSGALLLIGVVAACLGFMVFNFPRAGTFMGDSGSLFLGSVSGLFLLELGAKVGFLSPPVLGWATAVSPFVTDTLLTIVRRARCGMKLLEGDRYHMYDRLALCAGGNPITAVIAAWCLTMITTGIGLLAARQVAFSAALLVMSLTYVGVLTLGVRLGSSGRC